jgi:hypothetical protein
MPTQPVGLMTNLLNLATPDFFLFVLSSVVLSRTGPNESTWDLTNRICDRYFLGNSGKPIIRRAAWQELRNTSTHANAMLPFIGREQNPI